MIFANIKITEEHQMIFIHGWNGSKRLSPWKAEAHVLTLFALQLRVHDLTVKFLIIS